MSQLAGGGSQPKYAEELDCFLRRLETVRFQADGWQEPYESRGSCTVAWGTGGEIPPVYPTYSLLQPTFETVLIGLSYLHPYLILSSLKASRSSLD